MTLLIACILIYHFELPWWVYLVAAVTYAGKLAALHFWELTWTQNMDMRFNNLQSRLDYLLNEAIAKIPDRRD